MKQRKMRRVRRYAYKRRLAGGVLAGLIIFVGAALAGYAAIVEQSARQLDAQTARTLTEVSVLAQENQERREYEATLLKAAQEEAAREAAELAKTGAYSLIKPEDCNQSKQYSDPTDVTVVVNKKHCLQPLNYTPADLVTIRGATISARAAEDFTRLHQAAAEAGFPFYVTSSYRSYATQIATYAKWVAQSGEAAADTYSARPGYSEHQTGFAIDVAANGCTLNCFGSTPQYQWLQENAATYGFIQRYYAGYEDITGYKAEEWHYRYVGVQAALDMREKGLKTLEQYLNVPGGLY